MIAVTSAALAVMTARATECARAVLTARANLAVAANNGCPFDTLTQFLTEVAGAEGFHDVYTAAASAALAGAEACTVRDKAFEQAFTASRGFGLGSGVAMRAAYERGAIAGAAAARDDLTT